MRRALVAGGMALAVLGATPAAAQEFDSEFEARNVQKSEERGQYDTGDPAFRELLQRKSVEEQQKLATVLAADPERNPLQNQCGMFRIGPCLGDVRLHDWEQGGHGLMRPVLFGARSGATLSGHVWATKAGPAKRPVIVFITGSIQVPEMAYWYAATTLAKHGFVVLTFDVQGQGLSDTRGVAPDENENYPSQQPSTFLDGAEDALDFALSTPASPYRPRPSCTSGTDHSDKHLRRVAEGRNAAFNPLHDMVDPERVGMAGQSLGATAASFVGQKDPRVDAIAGLDNIGDPVEDVACASAPQSRAAPTISKPGLGLSNDYFIAPTPYTSLPDPEEKLEAFVAYRKAGVDSAQFNIRGGTHEETAFIPDLTPATLRGIDFVSWYTAAWFDKYLNADPTADRRLLTRRWASDARDLEIDPPGKGNLYSTYFRSRFNFVLSSGGRVSCDDVQAQKCADLIADDCELPGFRYLTLSLARDAAEPAPGTCGGIASAPPNLPGGRAAIRQRVRLAVPRLASDAGTRPRFPIRLRPRGGSPSDVRGYQLQVRRRDGRWRRLAPVGRGGHRLFRGRPGRSHVFRARGVDTLGGLGPWAYGRTTVPVDDRRVAGAAAASARGGWSRLRSLRAWAGTLTATRRPGSRMHLSLRGRTVFIVGRRGPRRGRALVRVDGRRRKQISFAARRLRERQVIAILRLAPGRHVVTIEHAGPTGRPIELDAFGVR